MGHEHRHFLALNIIRLSLNSNSILGIRGRRLLHLLGVERCLTVTALCMIDHAQVLHVLNIPSTKTGDIRVCMDQIGMSR